LFERDKSQRDDMKLHSTPERAGAYVVLADKVHVIVVELRENRINVLLASKRRELRTAKVCKRFHLTLKQIDFMLQLDMAAPTTVSKRSSTLSPLSETAM
jgi:hypothetical protein